MLRFLSSWRSRKPDPAELVQIPGLERQLALMRGEGVDEETKKEWRRQDRMRRRQHCWELARQGYLYGMFLLLYITLTSGWLHLLIRESSDISFPVIPLIPILVVIQICWLGALQFSIRLSLTNWFHLGMFIQMLFTLHAGWSYYLGLELSEKRSLLMIFPVLFQAKWLLEITREGLSQEDHGESAAAPKQLQLSDSVQGGVEGPDDSAETECKIEEFIYVRAKDWTKAQIRVTPETLSENLGLTVGKAREYISRMAAERFVHPVQTKRSGLVWTARKSRPTERD